MTERERTTHLTVSVAARRAGVEVRVVQYCLETELVSDPLSDTDLAELRRVRRLTDLGVNLPGVEAILHMRRQIEELRARIVHLEERLH